MKGWEALKALEEGKLIRSLEYDDELSYDHFCLKLIDNELIEICIKDFNHFKKEEVEISDVSINSIFHFDWEIYEEKTEYFYVEMAFCKKEGCFLLGKIIRSVVNNDQIESLSSKGFELITKTPVDKDKSEEIISFYLKRPICGCGLNEFMPYEDIIKEIESKKEQEKLKPCANCGSVKDL